MRSRTRGVIAASVTAAALLILTACTGPEEGPAPTRTVVATTPSATPSPTPTVPEMRPAIVPFGGDCDQVLNADQVTKLLGEGIIDAGGVEDAPSYFATAVRNAGGISCAWMNTLTGASLTLTALPYDAFPEGVAHEPRTVECEVHHGAQLCSTSLDVEGIWFSVRGSDEAIVTASLAPIGAVFIGVEASAATTEPDAWIPPACESFVPALADVVGVAPDLGFPSDATPSGIAWDTMSEISRVGWCGFHNMGGPDKAASIYVAPGIADLVIPTTADISVSGADSAWVNDSTFPTITVRVGSNLLAVSGTSASTITELSAIAAAVIPALNATIIVE